MKRHKAFEYDQINVVHEAMGLGVYINLAQAMQVIGGVIDEGSKFEAPDLLRVIETMAAALTWMDYSGLSERHPDLKDMPDRVEPLNFQGGIEGLAEWLTQEMEMFTTGEEFKGRNHLN